VDGVVLALSPRCSVVLARIPGIPLLATQRGMNRAAVFLDETDHHLYLQLLANVGNCP